MAMLEIATCNLSQMKTELAHTIWSSGRIHTKSYEHRLSNLSGYLLEIMNEFNSEEKES